MSKKHAPSHNSIITGILAGANLLTILLLWFSALSTYLSPVHFPKLSLSGLTFPIFLCANAAFLVVWMLYHARMVWLPLAGMIVVGSFLMDYCPVSGSGEVKDSSLCIVSFNVGGVSDAAERDSFWNYLGKLKPDIVCVQEANASWMMSRSTQDYMRQHGITCMGDKSNYVLSTLPMRKSHIDIRYKSKTNSSYACWVILHGTDSILVVNNHLESNHLSDEDRDEYREIIHNLNGDIVKHEGRALAMKLAHAGKLRGPQADSMCALVQKYSAYPILMCGDFNDTPISYAYQRVAQHLTSAFRQSGNGTGFSFNQDAFFVRIDHIFLSRHFQSTRTFVDQDIYLSDHYPIVSYMTWRGE